MNVYPFNRPQIFHVFLKLKKLSFIFCLLLVTNVHAGDREQAKRIYERIAGTPPQDSLLDSLETNVANSDFASVTASALADPSFYNVTLKNFAMPWTNRDQTVFAPLNDYVATVIGMVRDDKDFRELLYGDYIYVGNPATTGLAAYNQLGTNNAHYEAMEAQAIDMSDPAMLVEQPQALPEGAAAGIITSRAAARSFFIAGTNRAMFRFTLLNHLCLDLEQVADTTRPADRIRQDVSRSPGGDSRVFLNNCLGCHSGMDPLAQAFAYYNFEFDVDNDPTGESGFINYNEPGEINPETESRVVEKYHINSTNFAPGFVTPDDSWDNYWRVGQNTLLGWDASLPGTGNGASSMGRELSHSEAFSECQVTKVFRAVCLRDPVDSSDRGQISSMVNNFVGSGYQLKQPFSDAAIYCRGD